MRIGSPGAIPLQKAYEHLLSKDLALKQKCERFSAQFQSTRSQQEAFEFLAPIFSATRKTPSATIRFDANLQSIQLASCDTTLANLQHTRYLVDTPSGLMTELLFHKKSLIIPNLTQLVPSTIETRMIASEEQKALDTTTVKVVLFDQHFRKETSIVPQRKVIPLIPRHTFTLQILNVGAALFLPIPSLASWTKQQPAQGFIFEYRETGGFTKRDIYEARILISGFILAIHKHSLNH